MGKTLLGIDLDESLVGGLIESLLSEEDLEKLADGGRDPAGSGSGNEDAERTATDAGDAEADAGTNLVDDAEAAEEPADAADDGDRADGDETTVPVGTSDDADTPWETPSPGADSAGLADSVPSPGDESDGDERGDWKAKLRPLLLKATVALALLAVVAFVAYRYLGTVKEVAGDKLPTDRFGGSDEPADTTGFDEDVPAARRRAKASAPSAADEPSEFATGLGADDDDGEDDEDDKDDEPATVGRPQSDSDVGALVGLAMLALVAALVRKFGEQREHDPLVDGPRDDEA